VAGDEFHTVTSGQPLDIPAAVWNAILRAVKAEIERQVAGGLDPKASWPQRTIISVKNLSGADRQRFDVLGLELPLFEVGDSFKERPMMKGAKPDRAKHFGRVAVLLEAIPANGVGRCCVSGVTVAKCDFQEKWHEWADIKHDDATSLESRPTPGGAYVLWSPGLSGVQWCLVRISNPPPVHFEAEITSVEAIGETNRYKYGFQEQEKTGSGHAGWTDKAAEDGGRSGFAYNLVETLDDPQTVPAQVGETVWIDEVAYSSQSGHKVTEYWFQYEEKDQDAPSDGSSGSNGGGITPGGPGDPGFITFVTCKIHNRCGHYFVFEQKRLEYDERGNITRIVDIEPTVVPIYECESSGTPDPSDSSALPPESSGGVPPPPGGDDDWWLWWDSSSLAWIISRWTELPDQYWIGTVGFEDMRPPEFPDPYVPGGSAIGQAHVQNVSGPYYPPDKTVTGTLTPDATGTYEYRGEYNGRPAWARTGPLP